MRLLYVLLVIFLIKINSCIAADYGVKTEIDEYTCNIVSGYSGEINEKDIVTFIEKLKLQLKTGCVKSTKTELQPKLSINSNGGDVNAAIKLGYFLRENNFEIIVALSSRCLSSCVLVLAAGIEKNAFGDVGVHRPYFVNSNPNATIEEIRQIRREKDKFIIEYLNVMDIPLSLLDLMNATPPEKIKILTQEELEFYRLYGTDANFDEKRIAELAYIYGITSSEYRKREQIVRKLRREEKCNSETFCQAIMYGINESEYISRINLVWNNCKKIEKLKQQECVRNIMLK